MMKIMEKIFTGTIMRLMGSGEPVSNVDPTGSEGRNHVIQQGKKQYSHHRCMLPNGK